ncbi:LmeA family phospholipid-binding protein [Streptomyces oryzae]|uniref:LmeA family phospholipid-binding protein n=1 Tax=Streptomyces oryzae TaxID=1434886 RepID=A0ABS3X7Y4_9ACTN|nr:LmeA family phospholipid-binding protein [Streptomyces oryzae]MBO8191473.1 LmeA family phospholipid-binding protein [Streptomyces oryzae]
MKTRRTVLVSTAALAAVIAAGGGTNALVEHKAQERAAEATRCRLGDTATGVHAELTDPLAGLKTLTGHVGTLHIGADKVRHDGTSFAVDAALHGVSTDGSATSGSATVTVGYDEIAKRLPKQVRGMKPGTDGRHLTLSGTVGDTGIPVTVLNKVSAGPRGLTVTPDSVNVMGQQMKLSTLTSLPGMDRFADQLGPRTVGIGKLPKGVQPTGAEATDDGLALDFRFSPDSLRSAGGDADASSGCDSGPGGSGSKGA